MDAQTMPCTAMLQKMVLHRLTKPFTIESLKSHTDSTVANRQLWITYFTGKRDCGLECFNFQGIENTSICFCFPDEEPTIEKFVQLKNVSSLAFNLPRKSIECF